MIVSFRIQKELIQDTRAPKHYSDNTLHNHLKGVLGLHMEDI